MIYRYVSAAAIAATSCIDQSQVAVAIFDDAALIDRAISAGALQAVFLASSGLVCFGLSLRRLGAARVGARPCDVAPAADIFCQSSRRCAERNSGV
jgi:hypothetical protein